MTRDDILDAARDAVLDLAVEQLLDGTHDRVLGPARDWLTTYAEWHALGRHLLREADDLLDTTSGP